MSSADLFLDVVDSPGIRGSGHGRKGEKRKRMSSTSSTSATRDRGRKGVGEKKRALPFLLYLISEFVPGGRKP